MSVSLAARRGRMPDGDRAHIEELLKAYPAIGAEEAAEVLRYLKKGRILDVGLLTANEQLRPQLERFRGDHAQAFALSSREYLFVALMIAGFIALCVLLWDAGIGH